MIGVPQILVTGRSALLGLALAGALAGCGQKGPLYLPTDPAAANRATLPETLAPSTSVAPPQRPAAVPPPTGTASPVRTP